MTKQILVVALILVFVTAWWWTHRPPPHSALVSPPSLATAVVSESPEAKLAVAIGSPTGTPFGRDTRRLGAPASTKESEGSVRGEDSEISRDPFELPPALQERIRQRELAKQQERNLDLLPRSAGEKGAVQLPPLALQGVLWNSPRPQAIINRKILSVGDAIEGAKILAVSRTGVTVSFEGQTFQLNLPPTRQERRA